jgi:hypothetical protein
MSEGIIIAVISGVFSFGASLIACLNSNKKLVTELEQKVAVNQAVTNTKIEELTREVREHNNFAKRMPVVEEGIENLKEKVNYFHKV